MKIKKEQILRFFKSSREGAVEFRDLMRSFGVGKAERSYLKSIVDELVDQGKLLRLKGNRYSKAGAVVPVITGKLSTHRDGFGFVTPEGGGDDIFIPARYLRENMHGDLVEVQVTAQGGHGKSEGRIVRTLERAHATVVGRFQKNQNFGYLIPDDQRLTRDIHLPAGSTGKAEDGQVVVAEITSYPTAQRSPEGRVVEILGWPEAPGVEAEIIMRKYDLPHVFPDEVLAEAQVVSREGGEENTANRVDLRSHRTVTIDGETARDFDDAVAVKMEPGGKIRLWVSIADVSHFVRPLSALDREALGRGTSVYFPDRCIPMLPEELSNGICSLNPGVDRLTLTAEILFDTSGRPLETSFYTSVIRSSARLTYTVVKSILADKDPELIKAHADLLPDLLLMEELASRLTEKRRARGSIDFDLPEPELVIDLQGRTEAIIRAERNVAHRLIEEFMLAANEEVAGFLEGKEIPSLYRIHEKPDQGKLVDFNEFISSFGYHFRMAGEIVDPREFQRLLAEVHDKPEEKLVNGMLLRSMKQARYSAENVGHFGLAASCYTHFTSPIRRYPDLVVHRILKKAISSGLNKKQQEHLAETLPDIAAHSSTRERVAMEAEREIVLLKKVQFMRDKVGEEFDGFISGVSGYGFYVELVELFVEGMVHVTMLPQDFYRYLEKQHTLFGEHTGRTFRIGDKVRIRVAKVSTEKKQIDFILAESIMSAPSQFVSADEEYPKIPVKGKRVAKTKKRVGRRQDDRRKG